MWMKGITGHQPLPKILAGRNIREQPSVLGVHLDVGVCDFLSLIAVNLLEKTLGENLGNFTRLDWNEPRGRGGRPRFRRCQPPSGRCSWPGPLRRLRR